MSLVKKAVHYRIFPLQINEQFVTFSLTIHVKIYVLTLLTEKVCCEKKIEVSWPTVTQLSTANVTMANCQPIVYLQLKYFASSFFPKNVAHLMFNCWWHIGSTAPGLHTVLWMAKHVCPLMANRQLLSTTLSPFSFVFKVSYNWYFL